MPGSIEQKRQKEQAAVRTMIGIYCRKNHRSQKGALCPECRALWEYAAARVAHCPRMAEKTFCSCCPVHCYKPDMQERIRAVMRFSGPRMLFVQPGNALRHAALTMRFRRAQKRLQKKQD